MTGARQGELVGLKWGDLDWEIKPVYMQRTFNKGRFFTTKTKGSRRKIRNPEAACRLENAVFGESGSRREKGATVINRNPLNLLVGGTGFEPVTSTV